MSDEMENLGAEASIGQMSEFNRISDRVRAAEDAQGSKKITDNYPMPYNVDHLGI